MSDRAGSREICCTATYSCQSAIRSSDQGRSTACQVCSLRGTPYCGGLDGIDDSTLPFLRDRIDKRRCAVVCHVRSGDRALDERGEYKQVTVLFADVVRSMDLASTLGPERFREIMTAVFDCAATVVRRYGGTVDQFTGDGGMALFGAPVALEDHALRGCLAALGIQQETKDLAADVAARDQVTLQASGWPELRARLS